MQPSVSKLDKKEAYRYERKFQIAELTERQIELIIKLHPCAFSEAYPERTVNNIYFDTAELKNFYDNTIGLSDRIKYRIRWYGSLFGETKNPKLELKIKKSFLGTKKIYPVNTFALNSHQQLKEQLSQSISSQAVPEKLRLTLSSLNPALLNTYKRKYFISADSKFRITIDYEMCYYPLTGTNNFFSHKFRDGFKILELKYSEDNDDDANFITQKFPFRLSKNSKYVTGIERINYL